MKSHKNTLEDIPCFKFSLGVCIAYLVKLDSTEKVYLPILGNFRAAFLKTPRKWFF